MGKRNGASGAAARWCRAARGRNTADGQFYINLIDNARLNQDYTVFGSVFPAHMAAVDAIDARVEAKAHAGARRFLAQQVLSLIHI